MKYTQAKILGHFQPTIGDIVRFARPKEAEAGVERNLVGYNIME